MSTSIYVVAHKKARMPENDIYIPMQVGFDKENYEGYIRDNSAEDNISEKNANYCELTALYWIWKNCSSDIKGLVHYRRLLGENKSYALKSIDKKYESVLSEETIKSSLENYDIILPKNHNYITETAEQHYKNNHLSEGFEILRNVLKESFPEYYENFDKVVSRKTSHLLNIMICKEKLFNDYCSWAFDVLGRVESRIDISNYSKSEARIFGYLSELMVDIYVETNNLTYTEFPVMFMEKQNYVKRYYNSIKGKLGLNKVE